MVKLGNLSLSLRSLSLDHETEDGDTIASINQYLEENLEEYRRFRQIGQSIVGEDADIPEKLDIELATSAAPEGPKKRGRKPKNEPVTAVAPPPAPIPDAPAADSGIPPFLDRTAAAVAPPPPAPVAPPPAPSAPVIPASPPVGVLAGKVVAELKKRAEGAVDQGAGLVAWLAGAGMCVPGATFQEACDCVMFLSDEKLGPVANALGVA